MERVGAMEGDEVNGSEIENTVALWRQRVGRSRKKKKKKKSKIIVVANAVHSGPQQALFKFFGRRC